MVDTVLRVAEIAAIAAVVAVAVWTWLRTDRAVRVVCAAASEDEKLAAARRLRMDYVWMSAMLTGIMAVFFMLLLGGEAFIAHEDVPPFAWAMVILILGIGALGMALTRWWFNWVEFFTGVDPDGSRGRGSQ